MNDAARRQAELLLERNEDISEASFAGAMVRQTEFGLDNALDLYDELTDTETPRETDGGAVKDSTPDDARPVLEEAQAVTGTVASETDTDGFDDHYAHAGGVYETLGEISELRCIGNHDRAGWYNSRPTETVWTAEGRAYMLSEEYDEIHANIDRVIYATINYVGREWWLDQWTGYNWTENDGGDSSRIWDGGNENKPTPDHGDIRAYAPFADIDLEDHVKDRRPDGEIPQEEIEAALEMYIDAFAELAGRREHIYALDSVGGAYVMAAPTTTKPIGDAFDGEERAMLFKELANRLNAWLARVRSEINESVPTVEGVFEPDQLNNKNRLYKAPLSVHSSLDGVVTPLDTEDVAYDYTPVEAADGALRDAAERWADGFTGDHADAVGRIVAALWPEHSDEAETWEETLRSWLDEKQAETEERERRRKESAKERRERLNEFGTSLTGQSITPHIQDVFDAADAVDIRQLVRQHCKEWEPTGRTDHFNPGPQLWKESDSGTSCFVNTSKNIFVDTGDRGGEGGPRKFMALKEDVISYPEEKADGEAFWVGIEALRDDGYDIPAYVPERGTKKADGTTYEKTPYWALRKAAVALRVLPQDGFVEGEGDDGETFEKFPGSVTHDRTLDELEALDIDHGWERNGSANKLPTRTEAGLEKDPEDGEEKLVQLFAEMARIE